jgi:retinol dehydrogenase 12
VNHLGHFELTQQLLPKLKATGSQAHPARVVSVASTAHKFGSIDLEDLNFNTRRYNNWMAYGQAKLANVMFASELAKRMKDEGADVAAFSLHPGVIKTNLQRHMGIWQAPFALFNYFMKTIPQGAATSVFASSSPELPKTANGAYLADCAVKEPAKQAKDAEMAAALWTKSEELLASAKAARGL